MESIIEKIKKCLALSSSSNENEAAVALRQMNALLSKHNLTMSDIYHSEIVEKEIGYRAGSLPFDAYVLVAVVAQAFNCSFFTTPTSSRALNITFIGDRTSVEIADYAFHILLSQLKRNKASYIKALKGKTINGKPIKLSPHQSQKVGKAYSNAWVSTVYNKCKNIAPDQEKLNIIEIYTQKNHPELISKKLKQPSSPNDPISIHAQACGFKDGSNAYLHAAAPHTPENQKLIG